MRRVIKCAFGLLAFGIATIGFAQDPVRTVEDLDIDAYMGQWHQIAAIPARFQRKCVGETTALYERNDAGVKVTNTCIKEDGSEQVASAQARLNKKYNMESKLQVTFVKLFGKWCWLFGGDYWVMDIDDDYSYSVVGTPKRNYLWILNRDPSMDLESLQALEVKIKAQHYDTCKIKITQEGEFKGRTLCSLAETSK